MIALIQRVTQAKVEVEGQIVGQIGKGLLVLLGVEKEDDQAKADKLAEKVLNYRIFSDENDKMNLILSRQVYPPWLGHLLFPRLIRPIIPCRFVPQFDLQLPL